MDNRTPADIEDDALSFVLGSFTNVQFVGPPEPEVAPEPPKPSGRKVYIVWFNDQFTDGGAQLVKVFADSDHAERFIEENYHRHTMAVYPRSVYPNETAWEGKVWEVDNGKEFTTVEIEEVSLSTYVTWPT